MDQPVYNPVVPYTGPITGGFGHGRLIRIQGRTNPTTDKFAINLLCGPNVSYDDIALHISCRLREQVIVRNSKSFSSWGTEERQGTHFPIGAAQHFEILILSEPQEFKIAINGQHFTEFHHRVDVNKIKHIGIEGDVSIGTIQFEGNTGSSFAPSAPPPMMNNSPGAPYPPPGGSSGVPYPPSGPGGLPPMGFASPPPVYPPPAQPYGAPGGPYAPPVYPQGAYPQGQTYPQGPYPSQPPGAYPQQGYPQQGYGNYPGQYHGGGSMYPQQQYHQQGGYPGGYPGSSPQHHKPGMLDSAGKALAGGLAGVGLGALASKIPGIGGHHGGHHGGHYGHQGHSGGHGSGLPLGALAGSAAALGVGGYVANKAMKKGKKKNKLLKYGVPIAGVGLGGYALKKGMKGFGGRSSSSSSSSSSEEE